MLCICNHDLVVGASKVCCEIVDMALGVDYIQPGEKCEVSVIVDVLAPGSNPYWLTVPMGNGVAESCELDITFEIHGTEVPRLHNPISVIDASRTPTTPSGQLRVDLALENPSPVSEDPALELVEPSGLLRLEGTGFTRRSLSNQGIVRLLLDPNAVPQKGSTRPLPFTMRVDGRDLEGVLILGADDRSFELGLVVASCPSDKEGMAVPMPRNLIGAEPEARPIFRSRGTANEVGELVATAGGLAYRRKPGLITDRDQVVEVLALRAGSHAPPATAIIYIGVVEQATARGF